MKNIMIATSVAVLMSTTAFATDCKYVQKIILEDMQLFYVLMDRLIGFMQS